MPRYYRLIVHLIFAGYDYPEILAMSPLMTRQDIADAIAWHATRD